MYLKKIKKIINKFKKNKRSKPILSRLILNKMEQTTFIKKRKNISFDIKSLNLKGNNKFYYFTSFLILILLIYFLLGPLFKVKNVEIIKQDNITNMTIAYKAIENFRGDSLFNIKEKEVFKRLKDYQHNIKSIDTSIDLPNTLKITVSSYKGIFNTTVNNKSFIITENGTFIPKVYSEDLVELNIINKFDKNKFIDYKKVLDTKFINNILLIINKLKENIIELNINEIKYFITEREVHIKIDKNTTIIFNLHSNIKEQIEKISIFNKEHININKNSIIYIDLRIKNKIFYCTTENEYQCNTNIKSVYLSK